MSVLYIGFCFFVFFPEIASFFLLLPKISLASRNYVSVLD